MEKLILRDTLAIDRTRLANYRTLLSFVRTGLYLCITGIGIFQFSNTTRFLWVGWILVGLGVAAAVVGLLLYWKMARQIATHGIR